MSHRVIQYVLLFNVTGYAFCQLLNTVTGFSPNKCFYVCRSRKSVGGFDSIQWPATQTQKNVRAELLSWWLFLWICNIPGTNSHLSLIVCFSESCMWQLQWLCVCCCPAWRSFSSFHAALMCPTWGWSQSLSAMTRTSVLSISILQWVSTLAPTHCFGLNWQCWNCQLL